MKHLGFLLFLLVSTLSFGQSIEIVSFTTPLEVHPMLGGNININYKYTSESGSTGNHIYIGLEVLDASDSYIRTVSEITLENQQVGTNIQNSNELFVASYNPLSSDLPSGQYYQIKAILYQSGGWTENAWAGHWNTPHILLQDSSGFTFSSKEIVKGADISWMTEMESDGVIWRDNNGVTKELMPLLKEYDMNAVRLRVWVDPDNSPANGWCDIEDLVDKAILADAEGLDVMICIHYSDHWADPGKQNRPASWEGLNVSQLETAIFNHTTNILSALDDEGITPKWVQIGNETDDGLLWDVGRPSVTGFSFYARFLNAGANAVKTFDSNIKTILHISNGNDNNLFRWNIDGLLSNGWDSDNFDIIGMSLYPYYDNWESRVNEAYNNMVDLKSRYNKDVMVVEVGFYSDRPDITYQFLTYIIEKTKQADGLGVLYWEPIAHSNWNSYPKGAWDNDGSPSIAMDAFLNSSTLSTEEIVATKEMISIYPNPSKQFLSIKSGRIDVNSFQIYSIDGRMIRSISGEIKEDKIDVSTLSSGIYMIMINKMFPLKFVKE